MQLRALTLPLALCLTFFLAACSGGDATPSGINQDCAGRGENLFCLTSCSLGCALSGCSINRIAQNEPVELIFNQDVDRFSVPPHTTSILLRTAKGEEPVGDWLVNGNRVTFVPGVLISGARTFFGFRPNETYTLYMPSAAEGSDVVKSMSGDSLSSSLTCALTIGEIKDLNQAPPSAELRVPRVTKDVDFDTNIEIEFNEIIDPAIFVGITPETSPIRYSARRAQIINNELVCIASTESVILPGLPRMTIDSSRGTSVVSFKPKKLVGRLCIQIEITSQVKDLAGVFAKPHVLTFTTKDAGVQTDSNDEIFLNSKFLDKELSAGTWGNGKLTFSPIGGAGRHGVFTPSLGKNISPLPPATLRIYEWDLDTPGGFKIPKNLTTSGEDEFVTDGRFEFSKMDVPDGVQVHFVGSIPARISVRGSVRIGGLLASNGQSIPIDTFSPKRATGEPGGRGGAMGGAGGKGGDPGDGVAHKASNDGQPGQAVRLLTGHDYATRFVDTGGKGSPQHPADGKSTSIKFSYFNVISQQSTHGGGGGAFTADGGIGKVTWTQPNNQQYAAPGETAGGVGAPFPPDFPVYTNGFTAQDHFVAGGAGGGGSGSSVGGAIQSMPVEYWVSGRGGHGGGGAIALRVGGELEVLVSGSLQAQGGQPFRALFGGGSTTIDDSNFAVHRMAAAGGSGAGGALFLQINQGVRNSGLISVKGGTAGQVVGHPTDQVFLGMKSFAGAGSNGILHFQTTQDPTKYPVGSTIPASPPIALIGPKDVDNLVTIRSLWYEADLLFPPGFKRYVVEVLEDGKRVVYSDDAALGQVGNVLYDKDYAGLAEEGMPVRLMVEGGKLIQDEATGSLERAPNTSVTGFRKYVGLRNPPAGNSVAEDGANGYRFEITLDRTPGKTVEVKRISVYWEL